MKAEAKTIVLVTHDMATVETYCHRAMLIGEGRIQHLGEPAETGRRYLHSNFETGVKASEAAAGDAEGVRLLDCRIEGGEQGTLTTLERGEDIRLRVEVELLRETPAVHVGFVIANADELGLFEFGEMISGEGGQKLAAGRRVTVEARVDNHFANGRHSVHLGVHGPGLSLYIHQALGFVVYGAEHVRGVIAPEHSVETSLGGEGPA